MQAKILSTEYIGSHRFKITKLLTRFNEIEFQVSDADTVTDAEVKAGNSPEIVAQERTRQEAINAINARVAREVLTGRSPERYV